MKEQRERKEEKHYMQCPDCGDLFDMRDLAQVFAHQHWMAEKPGEVSCSHVQQAGNLHEFFIKIEKTILTLRYRHGLNGYPFHRA